MRALVLASAAMLLLAGCGSSDAEVVGLERGEVAGLQLNGTVRGQLVAVSDGAPELLVGDCDRFVGLPAQVCVRSNAIDGGRVIVGLGNPAAVVQEGTLSVEPGTCRTVEDCAEVSGSAVVWLIVGEEPAPVEGGSVTLTELVPGLRYTGSLNLELRDGNLSGRFDVVPRPDDD